MVPHFLFECMFYQINQRTNHLLAIANGFWPEYQKSIEPFFQIQTKTKTFGQLLSF